MSSLQRKTESKAICKTVVRIDLPTLTGLRKIIALGVISQYLMYFLNLVKIKILI